MRYLLSKKTFLATTTTVLSLVIPFPLLKEPPHVHVQNIVSGAVVHSPVVILKGFADNDGTQKLILRPLTWVEQSELDRSRKIKVTNLTSNLPSRVYEAGMFRNSFKGLVELVPGSNRLRLECGGAASEMTLNYAPGHTGRLVRFVYLTDASGDTRYLAQDPAAPQDYASRIETAAKLMQCFVAQELDERGRGRRTFSLERNSAGRVKVHTVRLAYSSKRLFAMTKEQLWVAAHDVIQRHFPHDKAFYLAITGFSRYDPISKRSLGHADIGGASVALTSSLGLCAWPISISDVPRAFGDTTRLDDQKLYNHTAYRNTMWALASTTMGAALHELGHAYRLPHSKDPYSFMSRGSDFFHRAFLMFDSPDAQYVLPFPFKHLEEIKLNEEELEQIIDDLE